MAAADEVPPHDQLLAERGAAQHQDPRRRRTAIGQVQPLPARLLVGQVGHLQSRAARFDIPLVDEDAVLEARVDVEAHLRARLEIHLGTEQGCEGVHRRALAGELTEEHPRGHAVARRAGVGRVMREIARRVAVGVRQRDPELHAVQHRVTRRGRHRHLGVADAGPGRHQVQFTRTHHRVHAGGVAVLDQAAEQPADRLQTGVRMGRHVHAGAATLIVRTVVVGETPRPDQRPFPLGQGPAHPDGARPAQWHVTGMQDTGE